MPVRIVTDSTSDLPPNVAEEMGITVVPLSVLFGLDSYRDGVDLKPDEFYQRLLARTVLPKTAAPSPGSFRETYQKLAAKDGIVSIHVSAKLSGTYDAAVAGKKEAGEVCRIEVIDTMSVSMGLGLLAITAARAARAGATIDEVMKAVQEAMGRVWMVAALDTLEFLQKGGRIGKAQAWLGSLLSIRPIISLNDGEVVPVERVRTRGKSLERLYQLLKEHLPATDTSILYSTEPEEADKLVAYIKDLHPQQHVYRSRFGPVLGTYVGPDCLAAFILK